MTPSRERCLSKPAADEPPSDQPASVQPGRQHDHEPPTGEMPIEAYHPPPAPKPPTYRPGHAPLPQPSSLHQQAGYPQTDYQQTGYPPPSYQPPPGYPPTGPPGYPEQPPRRSNIPLIAVVVAVALLLCAGGVTATVLATRTVANRAKEIAAPILEPTKPVVPTALPTALPDIPGLPTSLPGIPGLPGSGKKITIVYEVTGAGPAEIFYAEKLGDSPVHVKDAKLPWRKTVTMDGGTLLFVSATRTSVKEGSITCRVTSDGAEVAKTQHDGAFATAACTKLIVY
jgi:hypothetical protein